MVDENHWDKETTKKLLKKANCKSIIASSESEVLKKLSKNNAKVDAVLLDLQNQFGFKLLVQLKQNPNYANLPIIITSKNTSLQEKCLSKHPYYYLKRVLILCVCSEWSSRLFG